MKNGNYVIKFSKQADKDKKKLKNAGLEGKAKELLNIIQINPFQIPPKYEKLQGDLSGDYIQEESTGSIGWFMKF